MLNDPVDSNDRNSDLEQWGRYRAELHQFILKRIRNPAVADDLVQDVFVKALTQRHQLKSPGKLRPSRRLPRVLTRIVGVERGASPPD